MDAPFREFATEMRMTAGRVDRRGAQVIRKTARAIEADAKAMAPVDTGYLRSSISTTFTGVSAEVGPTAHYGIYVELGTSRMAAQPYLFPAADRHEEAFVEAMAQLADLD